MLGQYCEQTSQKLFGQGAIGAGTGGQVKEAVGGIVEEGRRLGPTDGTKRIDVGEDDCKIGSLLGFEEKFLEETKIVGIGVARKMVGEIVVTFVRNVGVWDGSLEGSDVGWLVG